MEFQTATDEQERLAGWRAAQQGRPITGNETIQWLTGARDYFAMKASKAEGLKQWPSVH